MADIITAMVLLAEARELAKSKPEALALIGQLEADVNDGLARMGFQGVAEVKSRLQLPVARIVAANKVAWAQIVELAEAEQRALSDD